MKDLPSADPHSDGCRGWDTVASTKSAFIVTVDAAKTGNGLTGHGPAPRSAPPADPTAPAKRTLEGCHGLGDTRRTVPTVFFSSSESQERSRARRLWRFGGFARTLSS